MDIEDAEKRLQRFAPAIKELFPETNDGIIESSHTELKHAEELKGITLESFSGPFTQSWITIFPYQAL